MTDDETIRIPVRLYRKPAARDEANLRALFDAASDIWAPAGIKFVVHNDAVVTMPRGRYNVTESAITPLGDGDDGSQIAVYAVPEMPKGPNGKALNGLRLRDTKRVVIGDSTELAEAGTGRRVDDDDARVLAHELGHLLGLNHPDDRLMYQGSTGKLLTADEIETARKEAANLIQENRQSKNRLPG
jgi:hypothetical protein